jgi:hypothetical protein
METHPLISTYKDTETSVLPLILVVGREPNNEGKFDSCLGSYDFDNATRCAFWNETYAVFGKLCGMNGQSLKQICRDTGVSPIAFTDISPVLISNGDPNKSERREAILQKEIEAHVQQIVSLNDKIGRTKAVVLSGHQSGSLSKRVLSTFGFGSKKLASSLSENNIPNISVPFMFGNNQKQILDSIKTNHAVHSAIADAVEKLVEINSKKAA